MPDRDTNRKAATKRSGATDCHLHIFGPSARYPFTPTRSYTPEEASLESYEVVAARLRLDRLVIVQPSVYGKDNSCTLDMVERAGQERARAIVVIDSETSRDQLAEMHRRGARGARMNALVKGGTPLDEFKRIADRVAEFGWHLQFWISGPQILALSDLLRALRVPVVFDHMGQFPVDGGRDHPEFQCLLDLMRSPRFWVKLCGYRLSKSGPPYDDLLPYARDLVSAAPDRCVWGTDWPHPHMEGRPYPDAELLLRCLESWAGDEAQTRRILVDNPARLYGF